MSRPQPRLVADPGARPRAGVACFGHARTGNASGAGPHARMARVFRSLELRQLAAHWHLSQVPGTPLCVARPVKALDPQRLLDAMRRSWPTAAISILDFSRQPAPAGPLEFPRSALRREAGSALWNAGSPTRKTAASTFGRGFASPKAWRVVAAADLQPGGRSRRHSDCRHAAGVPDRGALRTIARRGHRPWPRRPIPVGAALRTDQLTERRWLPRRHGGSGSAERRSIPQTGRHRGKRGSGGRDRLRAQPLFAPAHSRARPGAGQSNCRSRAASGLRRPTDKERQP